ASEFDLSVEAAYPVAFASMHHQDRTWSSARNRLGGRSQQRRSTWSAARTHDDQIDAIDSGFPCNCLSGVLTLDDQAFPVESIQTIHSRVRLKRLSDCLRGFIRVLRWTDLGQIAMQEYEFCVICPRERYRISQSLVRIRR